MSEFERKSATFFAAAKGKRIALQFSGNERILCYDGVVIAVQAGSVVYYYDDKYQPAVMKAIHEFAESNEMQVRMSGSEFDFVLGSLLTKVGLPLTRRA